MATTYVIKIDASLAAFIRDRMEMFFNGEGFTTVLDLSTREALEVMEFKRSDCFVSMSVREKHGANTEITLESRSEDAGELFTRAARGIASDLVAAFLVGLPCISAGDIAYEVGRSIDELLQRLLVSDLPG